MISNDSTGYGTASSSRYRESNTESFADRLLALLGGRALTPWLKRLGSTASTGTRITAEAHVPGPELLAVMQAAENVSLDWLLSGRGRPFLVWVARSCAREKGGLIR